MELLDSQKNWDQLGKDDPLWVVLSHAEKKGGKWDLSEFFATGKTEIATGRLTQALATYFDEAHGIDISPSMIEHANGFNPFGPKCIFHVNSQDNLHLFESNYFDFIYSVIVLQHIKPKYSIKYIEEFMRILKPGGVCVFQFTTATFLRRLVPEFLVERYRRFKRKGKMGIFSIPERQVINVIQNAGGKILQVNRDKYGIFSSRWVNLRFVVIKSNGS